MNKKIALGASLALLVAAYGGTTWYTGQRAQTSHTEALDLLRKHLGPEAVVEDQYTKGFFSSQSHVVLQWALPPAAPTRAGAQATPGRPLKVVLDTTVRYGPLAGGHIAAAVAETRISMPDINEATRKLFEKASAPTITTVRKLTGGHGISINLPAGEIAKDGLQMRWQAMLTEVDVSAGHDYVQSSIDWPELVVKLAPSSSDTRARRAASKPFGVVLKGVRAQSEQRIEDGLWLVGPGEGEVRWDTLEVAQLAQDLSVATVWASIHDMRMESEIERNGETLGMTTTVKSKGSMGPVGFDSMGFQETWARIDRQAIKLFQQAMVSAYIESLSKSEDKIDDPQFEALMQEAGSRFVASLPTYSVKFMATIDGKDGEVGYGGEIQSAPSAAEIEQAGGLALALLKTSMFNANARIPKAWLPSIAKAVTGHEMKPDEIDAMVNIVQSDGYAKVEGDNIVSALVYEKGEAKLNGKAVSIPGMPR